MQNPFRKKVIDIMSVHEDFKYQIPQQCLTHTVKKVWWIQSSKPFKSQLLYKHSHFHFVSCFPKEKKRKYNMMFSLMYHVSLDEPSHPNSTISIYLRPPISGLNLLNIPLTIFNKILKGNKIFYQIVKLPYFTPHIKQS
jgi:hypothetical protein